MAFLVEDGSGLANSNSYASLAYADAYFADRGVTAWTGSDSAKQQALIKATDYIETRFSLRFKGTMLQQLPLYQALSFPRTGIAEFANPVLGQANPLPNNLLKATCEYALRALTTVLAPDVVTDPSGYAINMSMKKVGPLEKSVHFQTSPGSKREILRQYPAADMLLRGLLRSVSGTMRA